VLSIIAKIKSSNVVVLKRDNLISFFILYKKSKTIILIKYLKIVMLAFVMKTKIPKIKKTIKLINTEQLYFLVKKNNNKAKDANIL
jgi:hypothetical protein